MLGRYIEGLRTQSAKRPRMRFRAFRRVTTTAREFTRSIFLSPILQALTAFSFIFFGLFYWFGFRSINDGLDAFVIAGCALVLLRFGPAAFDAIQRRKPDGACVLVFSVCMLMFSIGGQRVLREFGAELGVLRRPWVGYTFGALTAMMAFAIFCLVVAPPIQRGKYQLSPWAAVWASLIFGSILWAIIWSMRYF